jgi:hypothetical protein
VQKNFKNFFMILNDIDISKLPSDVRRTFKQLQVMHAEKKIQNKAKNDFLSFVKCMWPEFVEGSIIDTLQINLINWQQVK